MCPDERGTGGLNWSSVVYINRTHLTEADWWTVDAFCTIRVGNRREIVSVWPEALQCFF